jgi:proliferating cell nuclear antigen
MEFTIDPAKSRIFATLLDILSSIVDDLNIEFRENEIYIQTMDSGRISLFELVLKSDWFEKYEVNETTVLGVKLSIINKILNCRNTSQSINIQFNPDNEDKIDISLINGDKGSFDKYYQTNVYDFDCELLNIPEVDADAEFTINSITLFKLFDQLKHFGDNITIECNQSDIQIETIESEDFTEMKVKIPEEDIVEYSVVEDETVKVEYAISPICKSLSVARLSKDHTISDNFTIYVSKESPIMIEFNLFGESSIKFWIAPKISLSDD